LTTQGDTAPHSRHDAIGGGFRPGGLPLNIIHPRHRLKRRKLRVFEGFLVALNQSLRQKWNIRATEDPAITPSE
jgi:hypothetical protein